MSKGKRIENFRDQLRELLSDGEEAHDLLQELWNAVYHQERLDIDWKLRERLDTYFNSYADKKSTEDD
jgi:alpha-amylase/alpha-mannosidase (GH57 family)